MVSTHGSDGFPGNCFRVFNVSSISLLLYSLVISSVFQFYSISVGFSFWILFLLIIFEACLCVS